MRHVDPDLLHLLKGLTEFNPFFRFSAREAMKSKYFDDIRIPKIEKACSSKVQLKVDEDGVFDYTNGTSNKYNREDYIKMIVQEVKNVHTLRLKSIDKI